MTNIITTGSATDLDVLATLTPADLFAKGGTDAVYAAIEKEVGTIVTDASTEAGRKEIGRLAYKIAQSKNFLDKVGKTYNADLKAQTAAVDAERRSVWDKLEALQKRISKPKDDWDAAEELRVGHHKQAIAMIHDTATAALANGSVQAIGEAISYVRETSARDWQEFADYAKTETDKYLTDLTGKLVDAEQAAADRKELEAHRAAQAERDAQAAKETAEKAEAYRQIQIAQEAEAKAQRDAQASIDAANARAEKAEADAKAAAQRERDQAEAERKREEAAKAAREADWSHKAKINNAVMAALAGLDCVLGEVPAKAIVIAIAEGRIPHVKINY